MKTHRRSVKNLACRGAVSFLLVGFAATCAAQEDKPQPLTHVTYVRVKPDMVEEYQRLLKEEVIPAYKKSDIPWISAWQIWPYGNGPEFAFAGEVKNFAQFDGPHPLSKVLDKEKMQALLAKMNQCLRGWQTFALQYHEDMSFMTEEEPKAAVLWRADIAPGNYEEAMHYLKADILPSMKKAGLPAFLVYTTIFGEGPDVHVVAMQRNFAELDKGHPVRRTNDPEEARQIFARGAPYFQNATVVTMRHLPDLSYDDSGNQ